MSCYLLLLVQMENNIPTVIKETVVSVAVLSLVSALLVR